MRFTSPNIEEMLLKRQVSIEKGRNNININIGWEREKGKGYHFAFGEYKLSIRNSNGQKEDIIIEEDSKSISTRVWDCSVLTTKWFEQNVFSSSLPSSLPSSLSSSSSSSSGPNLMNALRTKVDTLSKSNHNRPIQVLELGSGTGLLSICLAKIGGTNIAIMSTEYGLAVNHLEKNIVRNYVDILSANSFSSDTKNTTLIAGCVSCRELDWYKTEETLQSIFPNKNDTPIFDLIVVTDCTLSERDSRGILGMIHKYGSPGHTMVVVGICNEREGTPYFIETAKEIFADYTIVPQTDYHKDYQSSRHKIMLIQV
jgi:predicted nicotinamide N-methyase